MSVALDQALYAKLTADTGVGGVNHATTGATGGFHNGAAPQGAGFPRVHFQELAKTREYTFTTLSHERGYYQISAFAVDGNSEGVTIAKTLAERIETLLTDPSMAVTGKSLLCCRPERMDPMFYERDDPNDRFIYSQRLILEVWLA